jgi:dUTP pyrophosphatase
MNDKEFCLNREEILNLIKEKNLIEGYIDPDIQLTPNGFDLTIKAIFEFVSCGAVDFSNSERALSGEKEIDLQKTNPRDKFGWWNLGKGAYKIRSNEALNLPDDLIAVAYPRSSLLRNGVFTQTAVWDAGFKGRSEFILVVENPHGIRIKQNARVAQLIFLKANKTKQGYRGIYQNL